MYTLRSTISAPKRYGIDQSTPEPRVRAMATVGSADQVPNLGSPDQANLITGVLDQSKHVQDVEAIKMGFPRS